MKPLWTEKWLHPDSQTDWKLMRSEVLLTSSNGTTQIKTV